MSGARRLPDEDVGTGGGAERGISAGRGAVTPEPEGKLSLMLVRWGEEIALPLPVDPASESRPGAASTPDDDDRPKPDVDRRGSKLAASSPSAAAAMRSPVMNSSTSAKRCSGSFIRQRCTTPSSSRGTAAPRSRSDGAGNETCIMRVCTACVPSNGTLPVSSSNMITPSE